MWSETPAANAGVIRSDWIREVLREDYENLAHAKHEALRAGVGDEADKYVQIWHSLKSGVRVGAANERSAPGPERVEGAPYKVSWRLGRIRIRP